MKSTDKYERCPLPKTHRRLAEAHLLWHQALDRYGDPDAFRANLNATIESLRNVTFVLQKEKAAFGKFDSWYEPWRARLKADFASVWAHDARTTVVHQGELESHSSVQVRLVTWRDDVLTDLVVTPETTSEQILEIVRQPMLLEKLQISEFELKDAAVAIERRWSTADLKGLEILEALAAVYGLLSEVVLDAHTHLQQCACIPQESDHPDFRSVHHGTGMLECMATSRETRTKLFKLSTGEEFSVLDYVRTDFHTSDDLRVAAKRYGTGGFQMPEWEKLDPVRFAQKVLYQAKRILSRDKNHQRMMFLRDGHGEWQLRALFARDRTEKHLLMREVAYLVEKAGCDAIIEVGEVWIAAAELAPQLGPKGVEGLDGRQEALYVALATREGISRTFITRFTRGPFGGIRLDETHEQVDGREFYMEPVLEVWRKQGVVRLSNGRALRQTWEPDALDLCFCGTPKRFAECCRRFLPLDISSRDIRREIERASTVEQLEHAEKIAKAALAQYVIWVKRHTVPTMHVATELHQRLVNIDLPAIESAVALLEAALVKNGKADSFVTHLRYIASIIGVPELAVRLVGLVAFFLFESGRVEEAILELDSLGDLEKVNDSEVLVVATRISDFSELQKEKLLRRAVSVAVSEDEKWMSEFALVEHLVRNDRNQDALSILDSIILESRLSEEDRAIQSTALIARWKIRRFDTDFSAVMDSMDRPEDEGRRRNLAGRLIDEEMFADAERLLAKDVSSGDSTAILLTADARIRDGRPNEARGLLLAVKPHDLSGQYVEAYALATGHLALAISDETVAQLAIGALTDLSVSPKKEYVDSLVKALKSMTTNGA